MSKEIRTILLSKILTMEGVFQHKYSTAYNTLLSVIELENNETSQRLPQHIFDEFKNLEENLNNLDPKFNGIPLLILEQYFLRNSNSLDRYLFIQYKDIEISDIQVYDLYLVLETFFQKLYMLAIKIADYYSLDIKLKRIKQEDNNDSEEIF